MLRSPGEHEVAVRVVAPDGHTIVEHFTWYVDFPPTANFQLAAGQRFVRPGAEVGVTGGGLLPGERYEIRVGADRLAEGRAGEDGTIDRRVGIPANAGEGPALINLTGQAAGRRGETAIAIAPAKRLNLITGGEHFLSGRTLTAQVGGLLAEEPFKLKVAGQEVTGVADSQGMSRASVSLPRQNRDRQVVAEVTGSEPDRLDHRQLHLLAPRKKLRVTVASKRIRSRGRQKVTVRGLAPREPVLVRLARKRLSKKGARANARGIATVAFRVTGSNRRQRVAVRGFSPGRKGKALFRVRARGRTLH